MAREDPREVLVDKGVADLLYMVIERSRDGNGVHVYRRVRDEGRLTPDSLRYVAGDADELAQRSSAARVERITR